jgi:hypothetical protein
MALFFDQHPQAGQQPIQCVAYEPATVEEHADNQGRAARRGHKNIASRILADSQHVTAKF